LEQMLPYQLNRNILDGYSPYIMHDMPIHPGFEIEAELVEAERSIIYQQAENRMHVQKALLIYLLKQSAE
jgi:ornithine carbamoyltransferase